MDKIYFLRVRRHIVPATIRGIPGEQYDDQDTMITASTDEEANRIGREMFSKLAVSADPADDTIIAVCYQRRNEPVGQLERFR